MNTVWVQMDPANSSTQSQTFRSEVGSTNHSSSLSVGAVRPFSYLHRSAVNP